MRTTMGFTFVLVLISFSAFATAPKKLNQRDARTSLSFADRHDLAVQAEVETVNKLIERVKDGDRSLCSGYRGSDMSGCAKALVRTFRVHSASAVRAMLEIPVTAAIKDRALGFDNEHVSLFLADGFLTVIENVHPETFFVKKMAASAAADKKAQVVVLAQENQMLRNLKTYAFPAVEERLTQTDRSFASISAVGPGLRKPVTSQLRARLAALKSRHWSV